MLSKAVAFGLVVEASQFIDHICASENHIFSPLRRRRRRLISVMPNLIIQHGNILEMMNESVEAHRWNSEEWKTKCWHISISPTIRNRIAIYWSEYSEHHLHFYNKTRCADISPYFHFDFFPTLSRWNGRSHKWRTNEIRLAILVEWCATGRGAAVMEKRGKNGPTCNYALNKL